jgi:cellulose synthase/poly-beta-1,6-N-acetylglucosamine synthase-like glycosyltransferase
LSIDASAATQGKRVRRDFGSLAGPVTEPPEGPYRVAYQKLARGRAAGLRTALIVTLNVAVELAFVVWLLAPAHHPEFDAAPVVNVANVFVLVTVAIVEVLRLVNVFSLSLASFLARDPVPVRPDPSMRVAFLTTIVPGKEPLEMVRTTLRAARRIRYEGRLDVWLLDEGDTDEVRAMCAAEGVRHFSRKGIERYNQPKGAFKAKTKHGNYNAWLDAHGYRYDVFLSVDPDHVPSPEYADRMLGYFRDPDVAFVVGPQCYANVDNFVTRAAESQQFPFHSVIQRAANAYGSPMLVGTNNAVRIEALGCIGGLVDSITEDMATGLLMHTRRNPDTGGKWRSVYTPDVVAVGEGPSSWGDYFGQQLRWCRGTFELLAGPFWRRLHRLGGLRPLHYILITTFYPSMALGWLFGAINAMLYLALGASGISVPPEVWLALYVDATLFQMWVYVRNRRYNVSPFEEESSPGVRGMAMSVFTAPIYAAGFMATLLRRPAKFVVTPKHASSTSDSVWTFTRHLMWAGLLGAAIVAAFVQGHANVDVLMWPLLAVLVCLLPPLIAWLDSPEARAEDAAALAAAAAPVPPPRAPVVISEREPAIAARAAETQAVQVVDPDSVKTVVVRAVA